LRLRAVRLVCLVLSFHRGRILAGPDGQHKGEIFGDYPNVDG
jgi:hypothetical protein